MRAIDAARAVGHEVTFRTGVWDELKRDLAEGRIQALPLVGRTPEREALYDFTFPYLTMHGTIVVRSDDDRIRGTEDLEGRRVAVLEGDNAEEYLRRALPGVEVVPLPSFEAALRLGTWKEIRKGLENGEIDLVQGTFYSAERDETYDFSPPHTTVAHTIVARKGSPVPADLASLSGRSILVMAGDVMEDLAVERGLGSQIVLVASQEEALRLLSTGKHDSALVATMPALFWIEKHGWRNLELAEKPVLSAEYCYAALPGNAGLLSTMSEGLAAIEKTGEYRAIRNRWLGPYEGKPGFETVARWFAVIVVPLLVLLAGSVLWSRSLRRQVDARARELAQKSALLEAEAEKVRALNAGLESRVHARTADLEVAVREMEAFSYSVAHDLRAPVRAIDGFTAILRQDHREALDAEGSRLLDRVRWSSRRMGQLIDDLLAFSRAGRTDPRMTEIDLDLLVRGVVADQADEAARAGVEVRVAGLPRIKGDEGLLRIVFENLLSNAIKFSAGRPAATVEIGARPGEHGTELFVNDNGVGFEPKYAHKLFGVFQGLHGVAEFQGTGIGLALVKRIVERHGGKVGAEGRPGTGATFWFTLGPARPA